MELEEEIIILENVYLAPRECDCWTNLQKDTFICGWKVFIKQPFHNVGNVIF
jgi:hypothetical protein